MTQPTDWFEAGCSGDCRRQHTRRPGYCALVPPPEPTISILRVEPDPEGGKHIVTRSIPLTHWQGLIAVAKWVSRGKSFALDADPNIAPCYPDATARFALGALHDASLLDELSIPAASGPVESSLREHLAAVFAAQIDGTEGCANRYRLADAALTALTAYLDLGDAEAWCKACRRVWDSKHHRCEGDAEQRLSQARDTCQQLLAEADTFQAGHDPDCECEWGQATRASATRILGVIDGGEQSSSHSQG
ncbi:hypothetical protein [Streptomyces chartreusis]|uniref:hypothetical protein n=1 Tax=Streptomyces chartreusis TaxID=1969 RepID=UPI0037F5662E